MESRDDTLLKERLAALPLETPPAAAWATIRAKMEAAADPPRPRVRPAPWWLALAAAISAATVLPVLLREELPAPVSQPAASAASSELASLMQRSQTLEREIRGLRETSPEVADLQYQWESAIEGDLALVDVGLTAGNSSDPALWRERVRLLEELRTATTMDTGPLLLQARLD